MDTQLMHPRDQLVNVMNRIYHNGMTTLSGGNLSIKDASGDIWITPAGVDKGTLRADDIIQVRPSGEVIGPHQPSSELPFHRAIYERRPDAGAVVHAHPPALVSFSIVGKCPETRLIPQAHNVCGSVGYAPYALPGSEALGTVIADTFAEGHGIIILENHGMAALGETLVDAFQRLETLDFCARIQLAATTLGQPQCLQKNDLALFHERATQLATFTPGVATSLERDLRQQLVTTVHRAVKRYLMMSTEGVASVRLDDRRFLITPTAQDRAAIGVKDCVLIDQGCAEEGKQPSRATRLHQTIYDTHKDVHCIISAQSPAVTAYAVVAQDFDSHTIPESYILLRDVLKIPFRTCYTDYNAVAKHISLKRPVALIENDGVLVVGSSLLNAFDRLEVAEYSAQALIDSSRLGDLLPIGDAAIEDLKQAFKLES
ncbi:MAG: class II aldolase/adducin family protein [Deinococcota bacterium]